MDDATEIVSFDGMNKSEPRAEANDRQRNQQFAREAEKALAQIKLPSEHDEPIPKEEKCPSLSPHTYKSIEIAQQRRAKPAYKPN